MTDVTALERTGNAGGESSILFDGVKIHLQNLEKAQADADAELEKLNALNEKIKAVNAVLTPLGTLDSKIGGSRDNGELIKAIRSKPDLMYEINAAMKAADMKLFPKTEPGKSGIAYEHFGLIQRPDLSGVPDAKMPADLVDHLSWWSVRAQFTQQAPSWDPGYRAVAQNLLNKKLNDDPSKVDKSDWIKLGEMLAPPLPPTQIPMPVLNEFSFSYVPPESNLLPGYWVGGKAVRIKPNAQFPLELRDLKRACIDVGNRFSQGMDWELSIRVLGGLNESFMGADVYKALQEVKAMISDLSNQAQTKTIDVNSALQKASAAMNAAVTLLERIFACLSKIQI